MALSYGWESYFSIGEQTAYDTIQTTLEDKIFEFVSSTLKKSTEPMATARLKGYSSPTKNAQGMVMAGGDIVLQLHATTMGTWIKHLLMAKTANITSTANAVANMRATATLGSTLATATALKPIASDKSPAELLTPITSGKLSFTFPTAGSGSADVTVKGKDHNGYPISETKTLDVTSTDAQTTDLFYSTDITFQFATDPGENLKIDADPGTYTHEIEPDSDLSEGLTIEEVKGGIPSSYFGMLINQGSFALGDIITLTLSFIGLDGNLRENVSGGTDPTSLTTPTRPSIEVMPNWGTAFQIADAIIPVEDASFDLNNVLDYPPTRFARTRQYPKPTRQGDREVNMAVTVDYKSDADFDSQFFQDLAYGHVFDSTGDKEVSLTFVTLPQGAEYNAIKIILPNSEQVGLPDPDVPDANVLRQPLSFRGYGTGAGNNDIKFEIIDVNSTI